jgi:hypothetical protein
LHLRKDFFGRDVAFQFFDSLKNNPRCGITRPRACNFRLSFCLRHFHLLNTVTAETYRLSFGERR